MGINEMIKNAKSVDPLPDIDQAEKTAAMLKGKFAALILNKRLELRMNQTDFAESLGVSQGLVSQWEDGRYNFTLEKIGEISSKLGLEIDLTVSNGNDNNFSSNSDVCSSAIPIYTVFSDASNKSCSYSHGIWNKEILQYT